MLKNYNRTIQLWIQYDGTRYAGWQRQPKKDTIQSVLENAISVIANEKITLFASGRTDAGVHAKKQVVSFSTLTSTTPVRAFVDGTNTLLPADIRVNDAFEEAIEFHAITSTRLKTYRYYFVHAEIENVFFRHYVWQIRFPLNLAKMKKAIPSLVGTHDFSCFQTHGKPTQTSVRTIQKVAIKKNVDDVYYMEITADGFLRHMVRAIMGTLVDIGIGKLDYRSMGTIIDSKDRRKGGQTAPAHGLFLWDVEVKRSR